MLNHAPSRTVEADVIRDALATLAQQVQQTAVHLTTSDRMFLKDFQRDRYPRIGALIRLHELAKLSALPEVRAGVARIFQGPDVYEPTPVAPKLCAVIKETGEAAYAVARHETQGCESSRTAALREVKEALTVLWQWFGAKLSVRTV